MDLSSISAYQACILHARSDRNLRAIVASSLKEHKLTMNEWLLLALVAESDHGYEMKEVATLLAVGQPHITALLKNLLKQKVLSQSSGESDRRTRIITVTAKGKRLLATIERKVRRCLRDWMADIPPDDLTVYLGVVFKLAQKQGPKDSGP
jgi:MarR family transcriptional regulator for hemolysin